MKNIFKFVVTLAVAVAFSFGPTAQAFTIGQRGADVSELQARLIESGYDIPAITSGSATFGYFGAQTQAALAASNAANGIASTATPVKLGAVAGPDIYSPYLNINGYTVWPASMSLRPATTTPCAFKSPPATSTLMISTLNITTGTTTATTWTIAQATTPYATTTPIATIPVASGAQISTTTGQILSSSNTIFPPSTYVVVGVAGIALAAVPGANLIGTCKANFAQL